MADYNAPLRDMQFVINELVPLSRITALPGFEDAGEDLVAAILDEAAKFAQAYQGTQRTQAMGGGNASSTDVYFQNRIEKQYGAESDGYKYLSAIGNVAKLMESI